MTVPLSNTKLRVPNGFPDLLESFTREVLREQPSNIFEFGAAYFERLLPLKREPTKVEPTSKADDRFYNNDAFKNEAVNPSNPQQQNAALAIQTKYRQHAAKKEVQNKREEKAAIKIQAGVRGYIDRQKLKGEITPGKDTCQEDADKRVTPVQTTPAAGEVKTEGDEEVDIDLNDPGVEKAALKIQAGFKGFKARRGLTSTGNSEGTENPKPNDPKEETSATTNENGSDEAKVTKKEGKEEEPVSNDSKCEESKENGDSNVEKQEEVQSETKPDDKTTPETQDEASKQADPAVPEADSEGSNQVNPDTNENSTDIPATSDEQKPVTDSTD